MTRTHVGAPSVATLALATALGCGAQQSPGGVPSGALATTGGHDDLASIATRADALIAPLIDGEWATGLAIGMIRGDSVHFAGYGHTAAGGSRPDQDTVFEIGSATKVFTSLLLADLVQRGEVRLDEPLQAFLPADVVVPTRDGQAITLLELSTHTSGLPRMPVNFHPADPANPYADFGEIELHAAIRDTPLSRRPGASFEYSNFGAGILGTALATRAHRPYETLVVERICTPLGMRDSAFVLSVAQQARMAQGHDDASVPVHHWDFRALAGAGGLRSTARDMVTFVRANIAPSGPLAAAIAATQVSRADTGEPPGHIGLGWIIKPDGRVFWHNGQTAGFHSLIAFDPQAHLGVVILANSATPQVDAFGFALLGLLRGENVTPPTLPATMRLEPAQLERYTGVYDVAPSVTFTIARAGTHLTVQLTGQPAIPIFASAPTEFYLRAVRANISFELTSDGTATALTLHQNGHGVPARRRP